MVLVEAYSKTKARAHLPVRRYLGTYRFQTARTYEEGKGTYIPGLAIPTAIGDQIRGTQRYVAIIRHR